MKLPVHVGLLGDRVSVPSGFPVLGGRRLEEYFAEASRKADGTPAIDLSIRKPVALNPKWIAAGVHSDALNEALGELTGNVWQDKPIRGIGVIFTTRASMTERAFDPGSFGVMFDLAFSGKREAPPREGCAVFLETIAAERAKADGDEEAIFTAIHELGHVFNLWHLDEAGDPASFMRSSARSGKPLGSGSWRFADGAPPRHHQCAFLRRCDDLEEVKPGGTPYGERGAHGPIESNAQNAPESRSRLRLRIDMEPRTFWWFEPVELEIELACEGDRSRGVMVPHEIDAGYRRFEIWIEEPDGARRRYRAPRRYCAASTSLRIAPGKPFRRDVSIFGEAGGFTFRKPGPHTIQALLRLPSGAVLSSNRLEVDLRPPESSPHFQRACEFFTSERSARLMFYRTVRSWGRWIDEVEAFARAHAKSHWAPAIRYSLGRARLVDARAFTSARARTEREKRGRRELAQALEHRALTRNRARVAKALLGRV